MSLIFNKTASRDYTILKEYTAGIVLEGREVKSVRQKTGSLKEAFVKIIGGEAFLINAQFTPYPFADNHDYDPKRSRKLLLHKKEVQQLSEASQQKGQTIVPLALMVFGRSIKLRLAIAKGKKEYEKRSILKDKAQRRDMERELKAKLSKY